MKTLKEVQDYFKNAKEVRCLSDGNFYDLTKIKVSKNIILLYKEYWIVTDSRFINITKNDLFAEIISYIDDSLNFKHLEEIEVSNSEKFVFVAKGYFIGTTSENKYVIELNKGVKQYYFARKINHEKNNAIKAIKKLMTDNDIKKDEL